MKEENKEEATQMPIQPKMRVQLLDEDFRVTKDRLVDQKTELAYPPKFTHKGPVKLEFTISSKNDWQLLQKYIDDIAKDKPEVEKQSRGRKPLSTSNLADISPREDILEEILGFVNDNKSQDFIIKHLRKLGYVFILTEDFLLHYPDFPFRAKDTGEPNDNGQYPDSYCWMVRRTKTGKDPKTDKYDPQLLFGFTLLPDRKTKVIVYLFKEYKTKFKARIPDKNAFTFASFEMAKFPHYMTSEEREKWQREHRLLQSQPEKKPSKFYTRWLNDIQLPKDKNE